MKYTPEDRKVVEQDGRYTDIGGLPSNYIPYTFKSLLIRPFTVKELRLVSRAAVLKEAVHLLRAIDLVISEDVNVLSVGDFYYVLMWLRIHSMPKTPYVVEWHCEEQVAVNDKFQRIFKDDLEYLKKVQEEGVTTIPCDTHNSELVYMSEVEIISLEDDLKQLPLTDVVKDSGIEFDFPRVRNFVEVQEAYKDPDMRMIVGPAQWIAGGTTLEDKIKILEAQPNLDVFDAASVINEEIQHGIRETVLLTCRGCATKFTHKLTLDATAFFR